jgi:tryptophan synthase alpha chain
MNRGPGAGRIEAAFARARNEHRVPLVLYLTAGDPDHETSLRLVLAAARAGMDILELGVPWSDPSADGLAIQGAMQRALGAGGGLRRTFELCRRIRDAAPELPIVLFGYGNPIAVMGPGTYAARARAAGADATLCVDWPADEDRELADRLHAEGQRFIPLLAPTSTDERVTAALAAAGGFIYYVSLTGITGAKLADAASPREKVAQIRARAEATGTPLPVVVGFGIAGPEDARQVASFADGVVVGSAAVRIIESAAKEQRDPVPDLVSLVVGLKAALASDR